MIEHTIHNAPELKDIGNIKFPKWTKIYLDNKVPAYIIDAGEQEILKIEIIFPAGRWQEPKFGVASFTAKMLKEGTAKYSSEELSDKIDFLGANIKVSAFADYASITIYTLNKYLHQVFAVLDEMFFNAIFPEDELELLKKISGQKLKIENERIEYRAQKYFMQKIFGKDHPYGHYENAADLEEFDRSDLVNFFRSNYLCHHCQIIVSGKMTPDTERLLNKHFGKIIENGQHVITRTFKLYPAKKQAYFDEKIGATQSAIRIGKSFINRLHPDYHKLRILNVILGGYFGSRLMNNLREDKGYTYGIYSGLHSYLHGGLFYIGSEVGSDVTRAATKEIYVELERLQEELITADELELVRNYILGTILNGIDGPFSTSAILKNLAIYGQDESHFYNFVETVRSASAQQLQDVAIKYLDTDSFYEVISGCVT